ARTGGRRRARAPGPRRRPDGAVAAPGRRGRAPAAAGALPRRAHGGGPRRVVRLLAGPGARAGRCRRLRRRRPADVTPARDLVGYGAHPPDPRWPGGARLALSLVLNYEEGSELSPLEGDDAPETYLHE